MEALGLEVKTLEEPLYVNSPLGTRVSVDQICRDCELEIKTMPSITIKWHFSKFKARFLSLHL